jgi:hypothetical protein
MMLERLEPDATTDLSAVTACAPPVQRAPHPHVRAYAAVARHPRLFGPQIVHMHELSGGETVAIIRTGGLRRLQRVCRTRLRPP